MDSTPPSTTQFGGCSSPLSTTPLECASLRGSHLFHAPSSFRWGRRRENVCPWWWWWLDRGDDTWVWLALWGIWSNWPWIVRGRHWACLPWAHGTACAAWKCSFRMAVRAGCMAAGRWGCPWTGWSESTCSSPAGAWFIRVYLLYAHPTYHSNHMIIYHSISR